MWGQFLLQIISIKIFAPTNYIKFLSLTISIYPKPTNWQTQISKIFLGKAIPKSHLPKPKPLDFHIPKTHKQTHLV